MKIPGLGWLHYRLVSRPQARANAREAARLLPEMRASISRLAPISFAPADIAQAPEITMITGEEFLYLTVFCVYSLLRTTGRPFRFHIINDRTLSDHHIAELHRLFPGLVTCPPRAEQDAYVESLFPARRFPTLLKSRNECVLFCKLLDVHGGRSGWRMFLDSDTFFHRRPDALLACMATGTQPCYMLDRWSNYGQPPEFLERLCGWPVVRNVNSGVVGFRSETIDWERMEHWLKAMLAVDRERFGFFEQGITAMLLSKGDSLLLPPQDYVLTPEREEILHPRAAFHHYAGESKYSFVRHQVPRHLFSAQA